MLLYLDLISGISGDMCLGALVDLGVEPKWLQKQLTPLFTGFSIQTAPVIRSALRAVDLTVAVTDQTTSRTYGDIRALIEKADLPPAVRRNSLCAFEKIAQAEAAIHGHTIESVHFHEIGGIDSLVDILGTFLAIDYLGVTQVTASDVPLGSGFVDCAHGRIPVPVPATLAILKNIPVTGSDAATEIVTPTGAAILATLVDRYGPFPAMYPEKIGYGAGKRETGSRMPNLLRMVLGRPVSGPASDRAAGLSNLIQSGEIRSESIGVLTTQVDDMNPEILGFVMDHLLEKGALDVTFTPVHMKKNRPGTRVEVLCRPEDRGCMIQEILTQTTATGVRYQTCDRAVLHREPCQVDTVFGKVAAKRIRQPDGKEHLVPEYEALAKIARKQGLALKEVYARTCRNPLDRKNNKI
ncbi:MAG: nickel pincer cofactor biosynthesis protein LarC [Desulfotignum sp.]|nr:nickel pincer cofactor biosynthesis protein LarC [Desulfotignum sp.]